MKKLVELWSRLNGHKTNIGSFLVTVYTLAVQAGVVEFNQDVLTVLSVVFGLGVAHKAAKYVKQTA